MHRVALCLPVLWLLFACLVPPARCADSAAGDEPLRPFLARYCNDCHSGDTAEGEVDLAALDRPGALERGTRLLIRVEEMISGRQMPPPEEKQPTDEERRTSSEWLRRFLAAEARAHAGDPGRVVLRRLNNAEYTHTIRDLTGVATLDPAREFPADGGAGEGFTNTGQALAMSPSLAVKYLDAAKSIAAHAMLLPDGIAFSSGDSRRDFTDLKLAELKAFYARYTKPRGAAEAGGSTVQQGITLDLATDGFLPVEPYIRGTLEMRQAIAPDAARITAVARDRGLSPKYLGKVWEALATEDGAASPLLAHLRGLWRKATPAEAAAVAAEIGRWQDAVWKFNAAGQIGRHLGRQDGPASWLEAQSPLVGSQEFRVPLTVAAASGAGVTGSGGTVTVHLAAGDAGDGAAADAVCFKAPRLVAPGRSDIPLRDIRGRAVALAYWRPRLADTVGACLAATAEALEAGPAAAADPATLAVSLAARHGVDARLLAGWLDVVGLTQKAVGFDLLTDTLTKGGGWDFISGWKGEKDLAVIANSSDQEVQVPQTMRPHGVVVHPAPERRAVVAWRAPLTGSVRIEGFVQRAHAVCGNGVSWDLQVRRGATRIALAGGIADKPARQPLGPFAGIAVREGDMICLVVGSRDGNHQCDSTAVDLVVTAVDEPADPSRAWSLAADCSGDMLAANPHADSHGRAGIWHFGGEPDPRGKEALIPRGSLLARWLSPTGDDDRAALATTLAGLIGGPAFGADETFPDAVLVRMLVAPGGPLLGPLLAAGAPAPPGEPAGDTATAIGLDPAACGRAPEGIAAAAVGPLDLCLQPPRGLTIEIPRELAEGCELVTTATIPTGASPDASVQAWVGTGPAPATGFSAAARILAVEGSAASRRFTESLDAFRGLFPKAVCYARIVPVDEVVTLNLFYREDDRLRDLLLDDTEAATLDRLWDELIFVSHEPLELEDAFEQLEGYATQDRKDLVTSFTPMRPRIAARAEAFRKRLEETQPRHVDGVVEFAGRAFRRPLDPDEERRLRGLYATLRAKDMAHDEAIAAVLAHVLVAPEFLYKIETPGPGTAPQPVSGHELATRLSYFLWSSTPDAALSAAASSGRLPDPEVLVSQTRRMLAAPQARRLAEEFGTQWLHVHGFSGLDEKNAELFPTFAGLRADMEEETIRFLDDFFRNDRSILSLIDADHTFLNEALAKHYGIEGVAGAEWRRVEGVRRHGRGGILGLATTLSTQAGASRTSPILRGNWLYEVILGEKLPKPPKDVPQLSDTVPPGSSERQLIALHSADAACAICHRRIDPFGFALEGFDAIGRLRATDAAGHPIDVRAELSDGTTIEGQQGLRGYLLGPRRDRFVRVFCRRLLGYALGRAVQLSDEPLLDDMVARLATADHRVSVAVEAIVTSPQFRSIRGRDADDDPDAHP